MVGQRFNGRVKSVILTYLRSELCRSKQMHSVPGTRRARACYCGFVLSICFGGTFCLSSISINALKGVERWTLTGLASLKNSNLLVLSHCLRILRSWRKTNIPKSYQFIWKKRNHWVGVVILKSVISGRKTDDLGTGLHYCSHKFIDGTINRIVHLILFLPHFAE